MGVLGIALGLFDVFKDFQEFLDLFGDIQFLIFLIAILVLLVTVTSLTILMIRREQEEDDTGPEIQRKDYLTVLQAMSRIVDAQIKKEDAAYNFLEIRDEYFIESNGDTLVRQYYKIEVLSDVLNFWYSNISGDNDSDKANTIYDLGLVVSARNDGKSVEFVALDDWPRRKRVYFFFTPPAKKGDIVEVDIEYRWPGLLKELVQHNVAVFYFDYNVLKPNELCDIEITMNFHPDWQQIHMGIVHPKQDPDTDNLERVDSDEYITWRYANPSVKVDENQLKFSIEAPNG